MKFSGLYRDSYLTTPMQVTPDRIASISDYEGSHEDRLLDLIDDHLAYVNNWAGTPDFSFIDREITDIRLENYILVVRNNKGNYVRVTLALDELEYYKELAQERAELMLENDGYFCYNSEIEDIENRLLKG